MARVEINTKAADFALNDFKGNKVALADFAGKKNVALVFNRGFA